MNECVSASTRPPASRCVLVIGSGPTGLAMAKCLQDLEVPYELVDRHGESGGSFARMYSQIVLASPRRFLLLPGMPIPSAQGYLRVEEYRAYLQNYRARFKITIAHKRVIHISDALGVTFAEPDCISTRRYTAVVVATGMNDNPFIPAPYDAPESLQSFGGVMMHAEQWRGASDFEGRRILIVGGGMRGIEIAEECAGVASLTILSTRNGKIKASPLALGGVDLRRLLLPLLHLVPLVAIRKQCRMGFKYHGIDRGIKDLVRRGLVKVKPCVKSLASGTAEFEDLSRQAVDVIVFATGYRYVMDFLPAHIPRTALGYPMVRRAACDQIPGLYILGTPCAVSADSDFVHGSAVDVQMVSRRIRSQFFGTGTERSSVFRDGDAEEI